MSETSSSTRSASGRVLEADSLVAKLNELANVAPNAPFSLTSHLSVGRTLLALRDALLAGKGLSKRSKLALICTGIALRRRHAASEVNVEANGSSADAAVLQDQEASRALLLESAQLVFALLCMIERRANGDSAEKARGVVDHVNGLCLWDVLKPPRRKRSREECAEDNNGDAEEFEEEAASDRHSWGEVLRVDVSEVAQHALRIGAARLTERQDDPALMALYFRSAAASMAAVMLLKSNTDFVSLGLNHGDVTVPREKKLLAIAQAAESEMGQSILRDLVLSFLLPTSIIGVRRGLLLSRSASTEAGVDYPIAVARAHDVAMAGAEFIWINGKDELERTCCLLAGLAILTTKGGEDPIRKREAFEGRVSLPFLETVGSGSRGMRLALMPNPRRWVLYKLSAKGVPKVEHPAVMSTINAASKTAAMPIEELVRLQWSEALENGCRDPPLTAVQQKRFDEAVAKRKATSLKFNKRKSNPTVKQTTAFGIKYLGGVDAAICQMLLGIEVSTLNHAKLFQTKSVTVADHLIARIVYGDDESGHVGEIKRRISRLPGTGFGAELERFFRYVLEHSTATVSSLSGRQPYEPWIAGFCEAVVRSALLRDADRSSRPTVAETITEIAHTCLQSVDKEKVEEVERKSKVALTRKAELNAEAGKRLGFGAYPVPKAGSTVAIDAGFRFDDFDEDGELLPDSDWEDEDSEWGRKKALYCKGMEQKGIAMDLKGRTPEQIPGARLTVSYDEDGSGKGVSYEAIGQAIGETPDAMWVCFLGNNETIKVTDEDDWSWLGDA